MAFFLLDTDAVIDYIANFVSSAQLIDSLLVGGEDICTCSMVVAEVFAGLHRGDEVKAATFLASMRYLPVSRQASEQAGRWRYEFRSQGFRIGALDALIAATGYSHGATIITGNLSHYPMRDISLLPLPR